MQPVLASSRVRLSCCCVIATLGWGTAVFGQDSSPSPLIEALDANGDGVISSREITRAAAAIRKLDKNRDGELTEDEFAAAPAERPRPPGRSGRGPQTTPATSERPRPAPRSGRGVQATTATADKKAIDLAINQAATLFKQKKYDEAGEAIETAQDMIIELVETNGETALVALADSYKRFARAHALLSDRGVDLPELTSLSDLVPGTAAPKRSEQAAQETAEVKSGTVSFTRQIAPILVSRCAKCHIDDKKGELSFVSYTTIMSGSAVGSVLVENDADASLLVDMVETGEMPQRGEPVPEADQKLLRIWVDEGAIFDGDQQNAELKTLVKKK